MFARASAVPLAAWFGSGEGSVTYVGLDQESTALSHVSLSEEQGEPRNTGFGYQIFTVRTGWIIIDPNNARYSGIESMQITAKMIIEGVEYSVERVNPNGHVLDFKLVRSSPMEFAKREFRGGQ